MSILSAHSGRLLFSSFHTLFGFWLLGVWLLGFWLLGFFCADAQKLLSFSISFISLYLRGTFLSWGSDVFVTGVGTFLSLGTLELSTGVFSTLLVSSGVGVWCS